MSNLATSSMQQLGWAPQELLIAMGVVLLTTVIMVAVVRESLRSAHAAARREFGPTRLAPLNFMEPEEEEEQHVEREEQTFVSASPLHRLFPLAPPAPPSGITDVAADMGADQDNATVNSGSAGSSDTIPDSSPSPGPATNSIDDDGGGGDDDDENNDDDDDDDDDDKHHDESHVAQLRKQLAIANASLEQMEEAYDGIAKERTALRETLKQIQGLAESC